MRVFLIHGMGRSPASMWILDRRMRGVGHRTSRFGYFVAVSDFERIAERFAAHVERVLKADAENNGDGACGYAIVSHSLGGLVARLAGPRLPPGLKCCAMLAPPNRRPSMVRALAANTIFRLVTQDTGRKLNDPAFYETLPVPEVPVLVIAGTRGPRAPWLPFGGRLNDSILELAETRLDGAPTLSVHGLHTFLMNRRDVFDALRQFLADPPTREGRRLLESRSG